MSYHTHTTISDGKLTPRELVEAAISRGYKVLAITDHYTTPEGVNSSGWGNDFYTDEDYLELRKLQEEYKGKIKILVGVEFEWYLGREDWLFQEVQKRDYDIKLISVHQIVVDSKRFTINSSKEAFEGALLGFGGEIKKVVSVYYETLREAVGTGWYDLVAHFDLIKVYNEDSKYFDESEEWYRKEVIRTLKVIKEMGIKMEVNLGGLIRPCREQYPSRWIIDKAKEMGIEFLVGTDAHKEPQLDYDVNEVSELIG